MSYFVEQANSMASDSGAVTGKAQPFFRGSLHVDIPNRSFQYLGKVFFHLRNKILQLRRLGDDGHIHIANAVAGIPDLLPSCARSFIEDMPL